MESIDNPKFVPIVNVSDTPPTESNFDDIRARGKGVGFDVLLNGKNTITISVKGKEFLMNCWGSYQAALDLIECEERRQCTNTTGYPCCKDVDTKTLACHKCMINKEPAEERR